MNHFHGFDQLRIKHEVESLQTEYKSYRHYELSELTIGEGIKLRGPGETHADVANSIYIPTIGNTQVVVSLTATTLKHQNYAQVQTNPKLVLADYLAVFFNSSLGKLALESIKQGSFISKAPKSALLRLPVPVPDIQQQMQIIAARDSLLSLESALVKFRSELSVNPDSASEISRLVAGMLERINQLSEGEQIQSLIRQGESKTLEFKETLLWNVKARMKDKQMETEVLKTIAAFLNTLGGHLLVGVADDGTIPGVEEEMEKFFKNSSDGLLKHLKNLIKERIGEPSYPFIESRLVRVGRTTVLRVDCSQSKSPCFVDDTDFYVRTNPATDKLQGRKMHEYLLNHFPTPKA